MTDTLTRRLALTLAAATLALATPVMAEGWKPQKPVEMVIMAGQGGGADRLARLFQAMIQKENLSNMPILPVNKGGGSGAEALRYLKDNEGDNHIIMATLNSYYTTPLRTDIGVNIEEFTPIARMAIDTFVLWVNADSDIMTLEDYVAAVKAAGDSWKMGGTGTGQEDSLVTAMLEKEFGLEITDVPFDGGGAVAKSLVGGHIDRSVNNPSEAMGFFRADKVRPIATFTPGRIEVFPDTPTMTELGHPPGLCDAAVVRGTRRHGARGSGLLHDDVREPERPARVAGIHPDRGACGRFPDRRRASGRFPGRARQACRSAQRDGRRLLTAPVPA